MVLLLLIHVSIAILVAAYLWFINPVWVGRFKFEIRRDTNHSDGQQNEFIELETIAEALFTRLERA